MKIGVLISGGGSNLQAIIDATESGYIDGEVVVVISNKKDAYGLTRAKNHEIDAIFVDASGRSREDFDSQIIDILEEHNVDLVCLAGYMRVLSSAFVEKYSGKCMNIHPALLPSFAGLHGQQDALDYGIKISGCTVHFINNELDAGPIILQGAVPVEDNDDVDSLAARILKMEHKIFPKAIKLFSQGKLKIEGRHVKVVDDEGYMF